MAVYVAVAGTSVIFLDTSANRYFALADGENELARHVVLGKTLAPSQERRLASALDTRMADALHGGPHDTAVPARSGIESVSSNRAPGRQTAAALYGIIRTRVQLKLLGLEHALQVLRAQQPTSGNSTAVIAGHRASARWFSRHDTCLVRSLALARDLKAAAAPATFVIGVKSPPFAAHSWVQLGDHVLNDTVDRVAPFTPILVL